MPEAEYSISLGSEASLRLLSRLASGGDDLVMAAMSAGLEMRLRLGMETAGHYAAAIMRFAVFRIASMVRSSTRSLRRRSR